MEDILWWAVVVLFTTTFIFAVVAEYWKRQYDSARSELNSLKDRNQRAVTGQATMEPGVPIAEYKKQTDAKNRKARPGYETNCVCPVCGCLMFHYLQGSMSNSKGRLFCRGCPHEEEL